MRTSGPLDVPDALAGHAVAVVDAEGNGQQPPDLVEISILPIATGETATTVADIHTWLIRPPRAITAIVTRKVHGISNADVANCPPWPAVADEINQALSGRVLVAHNASVEHRVIAAHLPAWAPPMVLDTLRAAKTVWPRLPGGYGLDALTRHAKLAWPTTGQETNTERPGTGQRRHRAAYDTWITAQLLCRLAAELPNWSSLVNIARIDQSPTTSDANTDPGGGLW